jgi:hypothetical protein
MRVGVMLVFAGMLVSSVAQAKVPSSFSVQGVLRDGAGKLQMMPVNVTVNVFDSEKDGNLLYGPSQQINVLTSNGLFTVTISDPKLVDQLGDSPTGELWIALTVGNDTFPRQRLTPNLMAVMSSVAERAQVADVLASTALGAITVVHNSGGTGDTVVVPFDGPSAAALVGKTYVWAGAGPTLKDVTKCNAGPNGSHRIENNYNVAWPGQYTMTMALCNSIYPCLTGSWEGWELRLYDSMNVLVTGSNHGAVHFTIAYEEDGWHVEHMAGLVGITPFECH